MRKFIKLLLGIFLIVAVMMIAIPNMMEAQDRAKAARVLTDLRRMETALEAYFIAHRTYPGMVPLRRFSQRPDYRSDASDITTMDVDFTSLEKAGGQHLSGVDPGLTMSNVAGLTTPVAYLASLPSDPFINQIGNHYGFDETKIPYAYHVYPAADDPGWILFSPGPDLDYDISNPPEIYDPARKLISKKIRLLTFFPSNMYGTQNGDIWRMKKSHWNQRLQWSDTTTTATAHNSMATP